MAERHDDPRRSSVAVGGDDHRRKRGLVPLLLGLLALLLLALIIGLVSCGGDDEKDRAAAPSTAQGTDGTPSTPSTSTPAAGAQPEADTGGAASADAGAATLTAGSASLLDQDAGTIADHVGEDAEGSGVKVLAVTKSGFFVGNGASDRQFVEYGGAVGGDESKKKLPAVGDVVKLTGPVRPAPKDPARTLKLDEAGAKLVTDRGAYVNADSVETVG